MKDISHLFITQQTNYRLPSQSTTTTTIITTIYYDVKLLKKLLLLPRATARHGSKEILYCTVLYCTVIIFNCCQIVYYFLKINEKIEVVLIVLKANKYKMQKQSYDKPIRLSRRTLQGLRAATTREKKKTYIERERRRQRKKNNVNSLLLLPPIVFVEAFALVGVSDLKLKSHMGESERKDVSKCSEDQCFYGTLSVGKRRSVQ